MPPAICHSCRQSLRLRLHQKLFRLQQSRFASSLPSGQELPLSLYWGSPPPSPRQLAAASWFFKTFNPKRLWTDDEWRKQNQTPDDQVVPEIGFMGRSNAGKSSVLNALLTRPGLLAVGDKPGKTKVMSAWSLSPTNETGGALSGFGGEMSSRLSVLDVPGYGHASQSSWGENITKYLSRRKHLKKVFVLIDARHGLQQKDEEMFKLLRQSDVLVPHQVIVSKCDTLDGDILRNVSQFDCTLLKIAEAARVQDPGEILAVGSRRRKDHDQAMDGISSIQWSVLRAAGLDKYAYDMFVKRGENVNKYGDAHGKPNAINPFDAEAFGRWLRVINKAATPAAGTPTPLPPLNSSKEPATGLPSSHPRSLSSRPQPPSPTDSLLKLLGGSESANTSSPASQAFNTSRASPSAPASTPQADPRSRRHSPSPNSHAAGEDLDDFLAMFKNPSKPASPNVRQPTNSSTQPQFSPSAPSPSMFQRPTPSSSSSPSPPTAPTSASPKPGSVTRGLDALMALTGTATKPPPQPKNRQQQWQSRGSGRSGRGTARPAPSRNAHQPASLSMPVTPAMVGQGVSRGMDAFMAAVGGPASQQRGQGQGQGGGQKRRRNRR